MHDGEEMLYLCGSCLVYAAFFSSRLLDPTYMNLIFSQIFV